MDVETLGKDDLVGRVPLPLAQLYRRAHNAVSAASRLNTAYCLWESALKLLGSVAIIAYSEREEHAPELAERLKNLARPSLGHWWEFVRLLVPTLADAGDPGFGAVRDQLFGRPRDDMPRAAGLDAALRQVLDGESGARVTVRPGELFDRLVRFRNREIAHGPLGQQSAEFHDRMGGALLAGVVELLGRLDVTAGRRLVYVADVRRGPAGEWLLEWFEMVGEASRRLRPLELPAAEVNRLPHPGRVYVEVGSDGGLPVLQSLHPLVLCNHEMAEVFFLNARRGLNRAEYLCYHPGRVEERPDLFPDQRALLTRVLGLPVDNRQIDSWVARSAAEDPPAPVVPGAQRRRLGEFELLSELGRGGMGVVYRAWQPSLGRHVALKLLLNTGDAKAEARFTREIHALGRVDHPTLVKTYTSGSDGEHWFYAMELVEGATLAAICETLHSSCPGASRVDFDIWRSSLSSACEQARKAERPIAACEPGDFPRAAEGRPARTSVHPRADRDYARHVAELMRQVAGAAHALHQAGVVHRDVKPGNIMVSADGRQAVLMDLGLAQLADDVHGKLTRTRQFVGTLRYASPEQVLAVGGVDRRSDVYSLGASLWELLTLRPMFGASEQTPTPELMQRIQYEEPEPVRRHHPGIPRDLEAIVHKCLAKDPKRRYATAAELGEDLRRFLGDQPVQARREHPAWRLWRKARRRPAVTSLGLVAVVAAVALAIFVPKAITAQRIADITSRIDDLIERGDLSGPGLSEIDAGLARLGRLAPHQAEMRRKKVDAGLAHRLGEEILTRPTVDPEEEARLKAEIVRFAARDAEKSKELERQLAQRVRLRQEVAKLEPPFDRVDRVFDPSRVDVAGDGLGPRAPDAPAEGAGPAPSVFLPSRVVCEGNASLDVTLRPGGWEGAESIGLFLYDNKWHTGAIRGLAYDRTGQTLVIGDERGVTRLWDIRAHLPTALPAPPPGSLSLAFGLPGGAGAGMPDAGAPAPRDVALGESIPDGRSVRVGPLVAAVAPEGGAAAVAGPGGRVVLFVNREGLLRRVREFRLEGQAVLCLALSPGGKRVAAGTRDGGIALLDPDSEAPPAILKGHVGEVNALAFRRDGALLASGGADTKVRLWDAAKAAPMSVLPGHENKVTALALSPDGVTLASGGLDNAVRLWNLTAEQSAPPIAFNAPISGLTFSPDRQTLAVGYGDWVTIWDMGRSRVLEVLRPQHYALQVLGFRDAGFLPSSRASSRRNSLGETIAAGRPAVVQLIRDGTILREQEVAPPRRGPLALSARLEGSKLELRINQAQSVVFEDIFPLGRGARGIFGLELPPAARIEHLVAIGQRPPARPCWMERGDELFAKGDLDQAADAYREQEQGAAGPQVLQEAKCKRGVCLADLGQTDEAIRIFEELEEEQGDRWPVIAGCRLWLLRLTGPAKNADEAYAIYSRLASKRRLEKIAALVPTEIPAAIVNANTPESSYNQIVNKPNLVRDLELARDIARDIHAPAYQQLEIKGELATAYLRSGQLDRARASYAELLAGALLAPTEEAFVVEHYAWVLGLLKKDEVALDEVDRRIGAGRDANPLLFICRAQIAARQGRWADARDDIDEFFRRRGELAVGGISEACLTRGFIRESLGDAEGARASWREGYRAASGTADMSTLVVSIMASLSGELTDEDAKIMYKTVLGRLPSNAANIAINTAKNLKFPFDDVISALRTMWVRPRGREYARKIALKDCSFSEWMGIQVPLSIAEMCRYKAAPRQSPAPEERRAPLADDGPARLP